jgi:Protein of unknown function (DUF3485)
MKRLPFLVALTLVAGSGLVHAVWKGGWRQAEALQAAVAQVGLVPLDIGGWQGKELAVDPAEFKQAGAEGYWMRNYIRDDRSVTVLLMCGRPGRMSVHTPEFCYQGLGYEMAEAARTVDVIPGERFWTARFVKQLGAARDLRLWWAWNAAEGWKAPTSPRWDFRGVPFLYKLYVVHDTTRQQAVESEPALELLKQLLPELDRTLFHRQNETGTSEVER